MQNCLTIDKKHERIMVIPDLQFPAEHPDSYAFLKLVKETYNPTLIVQIGDIVDFGSLTGFDIDPDYISPKTEMLENKRCVKKLAKIFPELYITIGNHEMRLYRKALKAGLPLDCIKQLGDILDAPKGWKFCSERLEYRRDDKDGILFIHTGDRAKQGGLSKDQHCNTVHGHLHANAWVKYFSTRDKLFWDMNVGCPY